MIARYLQALRPSKQAVRELALRETDALRYHEFQPIARGPLINGIVLLYVAVAAICILPVRLVTIRKEKR